MKFIGRVLHVATIAWCIGFIFIPTRIVFPGMWGLFIAIGFWMILYPAGTVGMVAKTRPGIDPKDQRWLSMVRVGGIAFIFFSVVAVAEMFAR